MAETELRGESRERPGVETLMVGSGRSGSSLEHRPEDLAWDGKWRGRLPRAAQPGLFVDLLLTANCIFNRRGAFDNVQLVFLAGQIDVGQ